MISRAHEKIYSGRRDKSGRCIVHVQIKGDSYRLPIRRDLANHSVAFEWGYAGSGPAQLALAILADCIGDEIARALHQQFKFKHITPLRQNERWIMRDKEIIQFVLAQMKPLDDGRKTGSVKNDESSDR